MKETTIIDVGLWRRRLKEDGRDYKELMRKLSKRLETLRQKLKVVNQKLKEDKT